MSSKPLNIVILTEGKAGHLSQSLGIANLIDRPKEIRTITVNLKLSPEESMLRGMTGFHSVSGLLASNTLWQRAKQYISDEDIGFICETTPDLVISAGTIPASFNILIKKMFGCKSIIAMKPSLLPLTAFDLVILPKHDLSGEEGKNIITIYTSPNSCRPELIEPEGKKFAVENNLDPSGNYWSLFLGGPSKVRDFPSEYVLEVTKSIFELALKLNVKLLVSTSRRTKEDFEKALKPLIEKYKNQVSFFQVYREMPVSTTKPILALSKRVFITEDSVSMVSESLWARRETCVIKLAQRKDGKRDKIDRFQSHLVERKLLTLISSTADILKLEKKSESDTDWSSFDDIDKVKSAVNSILSSIV